MDGSAAAPRLILCTIPPARAEALATTLVDESLVACVNIIPAVKSIYRWQGRMELDEESLLVMKTTADRLEELTARILALHPYEVPEVIALTINNGEGNPAYLRWLGGCVE